MLLLVAACSSGENGTSTATALGTSEAPSPTEIVVDASGAMNGELDLSYLPDDPTELMMASLEEPLDRVAWKMAYSGNQTYIPVLLEYLRFQAEEGGVINMTSFPSRLKDNVPPDGYVGWKGQLYSILDPRLGAFLHDGVKTDSRIEEVVWGGVAKDGIPDLIDLPVVSASQADYLLHGDRVFGVSINGQHRAYPLRIMNRHEMANDVIAGVPFALAY